MDNDLRPSWKQSLQIGKPDARRLAVAVVLVLAAISLAIISFLLHVNLSTAGFLELLLVLLAALRLGFSAASVVSVAAFLGLNFFFTEPVFTFTVADPKNWVSLFTFEATALLVSGLSGQVRVHAVHAEQQRVRAAKLYELTRAILVLDHRESIADQLSSLIREIFCVQEVEIFLRIGGLEEKSVCIEDTLARTPSNYEVDRDDAAAHTSHRVLRLGGDSLGHMSMHGWDVDSLTADAVASLCAITLERIHASQREARAELERDAERLRTAVLDSLAHCFKTPLTAIRTASSGLITLDRLDGTQAELVSIIDDRVTMLSQLTTRLLQTASLEAKEMRVHHSDVHLVSLIEEVVKEQDQAIRSRIQVESVEQFCTELLDSSLIEVSLQQLLDNAAKYSALGTPIFVRVSQTARETLFAVTNKSIAGQPIPKEEHTKIFERYHRATGTQCLPVGTGLGLSIVKKIAEAHGGRAWVECVGDDTRFIFTVQRH